MNREQVWREFDALSPQAQQQVADFIAFLRSRPRQDAPVVQPGLEALINEPFIGMWRDREDLADSTGWVRDLRAQEWTRRHD